MCGILGAVWRMGPVADRGTAQAALSLIRHRGPDAEGLYFGAGVFLGHRRLSIIDLDPRANQPMQTGHMVISFNGEIYNYRELRTELERHGHRFLTTSDTEVLLAAYSQFGKACLQRLEGMFAFAIWDERERSIFLARDRFGEKPLFYYRDDNQFMFSSEIAPIRMLVGSEQLEEDREAIGLYFLFSCIPAPYSPYRKLSQLEPGCWMKFETASWSADGGRYYELGAMVEKQVGTSYTESIEILRAKLASAVMTRFGTSDVPVATFLSGGIDSSIITTLAAMDSDKEISAYSIGFPDDPEFDESAYAKAVAQLHPNVKHRLIPVTESELEGFVDATLARLSEPFADSSLIPTAYLCSQVDEKVILGGDAADELFGGYGIYPAMMTSARIPRFAKRLLLAHGRHRNPHAIRNPLYRSWALFLRHIQESSVDEYLNWRQYATPDDVHALGFKTEQVRTIEGQIKGVESGLLKDIQVADFRFNLPNDMLKKVDYASMQHSLEVRLPFLDSSLVEWALSLPGSYKIRWHERKRILRGAFASQLPPGVLKRRKQGFLLPVRRWFRDGLLHHQLCDLIGRQSLFDPNFLQRRLSDHARGFEDNSVFLWSLFVYLRWRVA